MALLHPNEMWLILGSVPIPPFCSKNYCLCDKNSTIKKHFWLPNRVFGSLIHVNRSFFETMSKNFQPESTKGFNDDENPKSPPPNQLTCNIFNPHRTDPSSTTPNV